MTWVPWGSKEVTAAGSACVLCRMVVLEAAERSANVWSLFSVLYTYKFLCGYGLYKDLMPLHRSFFFLMNNNTS